jgi:Fe-Mn family superoxide dismutase
LQKSVKITEKYSVTFSTRNPFNVMRKPIFLLLLLTTSLIGLSSAFTWPEGPAPAAVFTLPPLPYATDALEPHIDKMTMEIHHDRHHQAYVNNLNKAVDGTPMASMSLEELLKNISKHPVVVRNNGGGHYNHSLFWILLSPANSVTQPSGELAAALTKKFESFEAFKEKFAKAATDRFGSGWVWLIMTRKGELMITSTPNQDNPLMDVVPEVERGYPLLGLDVWEHAYYLKYQNKRADYVSAWWNVVNWKEVEKRYSESLKIK